MTSFALPIPSAAGSLEAYVQSVNSFPILTQEQETDLGRRLRATEQGRSPQGNHDAVWIYDRR